MSKRKRVYGATAGAKRSFTMKHYAKQKRSSFESKVKKDIRVLKKGLGQQIGVISRRRSELAIPYTLTDIRSSSTNAGSGTNTRFFRCTEGDSDFNRDGNHIVPLNVDVRMALKTEASGTTFLRMIMVQWAQLQGAPSDILEYVSDSQGAYAAINSPYARNPETQPKILFDKVVKITKPSIAADTGTGEFVKLCKLYHSFKKKNGATGPQLGYPGPTASAPEKGTVVLYMVAAPTQDPTDPAPKVEWVSKERFIK